MATKTKRDVNRIDWSRSRYCRLARSIASCSLLAPEPGFEMTVVIYVSLCALLNPSGFDGRVACL